MEITDEPLEAKLMERIKGWQTSQEGQQSAYEYERSFVEMMHHLGQDILQASVGKEEDSKKKELATSFGKVVVPKRHVLSRHNAQFKMSAYLQEVSCWVGQQEVFDKSSEALAKLLQVKVSDKQVERLCHYYGQALEEQHAQLLEQGATHCFEADRQDEVHYVMVDGAQFLFREQGWKEAKLGRIFPADSLLEESAKRHWIKESLYVAHYGGHEGFERKMEHYMDGLDKLVIVADGEPWIWKWAEAMYPEQTQILDFYHAMEHLGGFATIYFKENAEAKAWIEQQKERLLADDFCQVIEAIWALPPTRKVATEQARVSLVNYYQKNQKRMMYGSFRKQGFLIGSGPIEAAHRHVLQQRLKLSGQRWTVNGFQAVANLRASEKSQQWQKVIDLTQKIAA